MIKLPVPLEDTSVVDIYSTCVNGFTNSDLVMLLLSYKEKVSDISKEYYKYIPNDIEHFPDYAISADDKKKLINVYDRKFSKSEFPKGRKYYDQIKAASNGKCAICEIGQASTLDHYLPKNQYPLLCVTPANLVPECQSCNKNKGTSIEKKLDKMFIHPYFDDLSGIQWLEVRLIFHGSVEFEYYNNFDKDKILSERIDITADKYQLYSLYGIQANSEVSNNIYYWKYLLDESGEDALKYALNLSQKSRELHDINSWSSALYRSLINSFDELVEWLNNYKKLSNF